MITKNQGTFDRMRAGFVPVPHDEREKFECANAALDYIHGQSIAELVPEDEIDTEVCDPFDSAFEYVCTGDSTMLDRLLLTVPHAPMLTDVLNSMDDVKELFEL